MGRKIPVAIHSNSTQLVEFLVTNHIRLHHNDHLPVTEEEKETTTIIAHEPELDEFLSFMIRHDSVSSKVCRETHARITSKPIPDDSSVMYQMKPGELKTSQPDSDIFIIITAFCVTFVLCIIVRHFYLRSVNATFRPKVLEIYEEHNPDKVGDVDMVLAAYLGKEGLLMRKLHEKYQKETTKDK